MFHCFLRWWKKSGGLNPLRLVVYLISLFTTGCLTSQVVGNGISSINSVPKNWNIFISRIFLPSNYLGSKSDLNRYPATPPMAFRKTWHASFTNPGEGNHFFKVFLHLSQTGTTIFSRKKWVADPQYPVLLWVKWCFSTPTSMLRLSPSMVAFPHGSTSFVRFSRAKCEFWFVLQVYAKMRNHVTFQITIITYMEC